MQVERRLNQPRLWIGVRWALGAGRAWGDNARVVWVASMWCAPESGSWQLGVGRWEMACRFRGPSFNSEIAFAAWIAQRESAVSAHQQKRIQAKGNPPMNDCDQRRYDRLTRIQTFGREDSRDFVADSKAETHVANIDDH